MTIQTINVAHFFMELSMILLFAKCFGELATRLNQSEIIGELFAGLILGPSILNIVHSNSILFIMSEIGAMILLFDVGLSVNIKKFIKVSNVAFLVAISGITIPYLFCYIVFTCFNFEKNNALFAAAILTATSIAVTARIFKDYNRLETKEAEIVLGAAFIDDILGIIMLTIISNIVTGKIITTYSIAVICLRIISFFILVMLLGLILPIIYKYIVKIKQPYTILIVSIAICFMIAVLSVKLELAIIVGSFIAGIILTRTKNIIPQIKQDIKPLYAFFVPIFFVSMGSNVKLNILNPFISNNAKFLIMIIILFIVAFIGKLLSGLIILKKGLDKFLIGISMVPRGEVGLIFANIGLQNHIFGSHYYTVLVIVIMLLTLSTPIILKYLFVNNH